MKITITMAYHHPSIRGKGWRTRREKEMIDRIGRAIRYAYMPEDFPNTTVLTDVTMGSSSSLATILVEGINLNQAIKVVDFLNNNENVQAALDTAAKCETMPV